MELDGMLAAVAVDDEWAAGKSIRYLLGPGPGSAADWRGLIEARVLDSRDSRGLWIEINTERHALDPGVPLGRLMIPWRYVCGIVLDVIEANEEQKSLGEFQEFVEKLGVKETAAV